MVRGDAADRAVVAEPRSAVSSSTQPVVPALRRDWPEADRDHEPAAPPTPHPCVRTASQVPTMGRSPPPPDA
jgi:hypothetical protein